MKIKSGKAKGRRAAQETAILLRKYWPDAELEDIRVTPGGVSGDDIQFSPAGSARYPFAIECKNVEKLNIWDALAQAEARRSVKKMPVLFFRRNKSKMYVALDADEFLKLVT